MTQAISGSSVTSFAAQLAELLIQNETVQAEADRSQRDAARAAYLSNAQAQVEALHAAADATEIGALAGAAFSIAGGACAIGAAECKFDAQTTARSDTLTIAGHTREANYLQSASKGFCDLAGPAKALIGDGPAEHGKAEAKRFETLAEQQKWQASDASTEIDKTNRLGDKLLDLVQSLNQAQDSATNAVIGRI